MSRETTLVTALNPSKLDSVRVDRLRARIALLKTALTKATGARRKQIEEELRKAAHELKTVDGPVSSPPLVSPVKEISPPPETKDAADLPPPPKRGEDVRFPPKAMAITGEELEMLRAAASALDLAGATEDATILRAMIDRMARS